MSNTPIDPDAWCCDDTGNLTPPFTPIPGRSTDLDTATSTPGWGEDRQRPSKCLVLNPRRLSLYLRDHLRRRWAQPDSAFDFPELAGYRIAADNAQAITIGTNEEYTPESAGQLPRIIIKRNAYSEQPRSIGKKIGDAKELDGTYQHGAKSTYASNVVGSHTLFCSGGTALIAELISIEVFQQLLRQSPAILGEVNDLQRFVIQQAGDVAELKNSENQYVVPVTVAWVYVSAWTLTEHSHPLKSVEFEVN